MSFDMEKLIREHKDKLTDADRTPLEAAINKARETAKGENVDAMKSAVDELQQASQAFSKVLYEANNRGGDAGAAGPAEPAGKPADEDAIDAEFEVK
jgi:molecular chaperone DnaK